MSSHWAVRGVMFRLAALWLVALLAGPGVGAHVPDPAPETGAPTQDAGMNALPGPAASAAIAVAPVSPASPLSAYARVSVTFSIVTSARAADRAPRLPLTVRSAPAILRL